MKKSRFSEHQIITILKSVEAGRTARDVCREHGISSATFHGWKSRFGGMEAPISNACAILSMKTPGSSKCTRTRVWKTGP